MRPLLVLAVLLAAWASARGTAPTSGSGAPLTSEPRRIVSLVPALTEMLFEMGAGPQLVGVGTFDALPPGTAALPRVGGLIDPDVERILSLRPDLVIIYSSQEGLSQQLMRAGIPSFVYTHGGVAAILETMRQLGARVGRAGEGERMAAALEARLDAIRDRVASQPRPRTLVIFGRERLSLRNVYASGGTGFLHDMLEIAGGENVFGEVARESLQVTTETLLTSRAEVVLDLRVHEGLSSEEVARERDVWRRLPALPAVRNGRVHVLSGSHLVIPGPRVAAAVEAMARALHPGAFE